MTVAKLALALLASALLCAGAGGCGDSGTAPKTHDSSSAAQPSTKPDRDDDGDHNDDDAQFFYYGHAATASERQALVPLLRGYYAAAGAADGAKACALLAPFVAEAVVEDIGHHPGLHGGSCAAVMSKFFAQRHALLSAESATLKLVTLRVQGDKALAVVESAALREVRQLTERRIGGHWRVLNLLDAFLE